VAPESTYAPLEETWVLRAHCLMMFEVVRCKSVRQGGLEFRIRQLKNMENDMCRLTTMENWKTLPDLNSRVDTPEVD